MRLFLSKSIAGGLSAGVVLLWWPLLFPADTVTSWLARGVAWTVCTELLLLAVGPLETALWETRRGERMAGRAYAAASRLRAGSPRRTLARLGAVAAAALAVPGALLAAGMSAGTPSGDEARPVKVVEVTRVTRPVTVRRVERVVAAPTPGAEATPAPPSTGFPRTASSRAPSPVPPAAAKPRRSRPAPERVEQPARTPVSEPAPEPPAPSPEPPAPAEGSDTAGEAPAAKGSRA